MKNLPHFEERNITQPLEELEITNETVEKSLSSMKAGKSQGPDIIYPHMKPVTKLSNHLKTIQAVTGQS